MSMVYVVEQNRDAQMHALLVNELDIDPATWCACCTTTARPLPRVLSPRAITKHVHALGSGAHPCPRQSCRQSRRPHDLSRQTPAAPPPLAANKVGYTRRDYEGKVSTLCAGCGHDSISAAIIQACWELDIEPHRVAKLSGIGCSSKTPDYFLAPHTDLIPCTAACPRC